MILLAASEWFPRTSGLQPVDAACSDGPNGTGRAASTMDTWDACIGSTGRAQEDSSRARLSPRKAQAAL